MGVINVKKTEAILRIPLLHTHTHTLAQNDFFLEEILNYVVEIWNWIVFCDKVYTDKLYHLNIINSKTRIVKKVAIMFARNLKILGCFMCLVSVVLWS